MGIARTTQQKADAGYMSRAIHLAARASGRTAPNPMVGCVLVKDGKIVGEGWHEGPGLDHAEVMALKAAGPEAAGSTAYVTLEPCNHTGRTGPCAEALIAAKVAEVVYAIADPNPLASGGADRLRAAGVAVRNGAEQYAAEKLNKAWLHAQKTGRPFVVAKSAMSLDGRIATSGGESQWITSPESRAAGHLLRADADAILVGAETVLADDPALTVRLNSETRHPLRVVLDSTARTPAGAKVYERAGAGALLATTSAAPPARLAAFREMGVDIAVLPSNEANRVDPHAVLEALFQRDVRHLLIEGGGAVLGAFFDADLIDEAHLFIAPVLIGGGKPAFGGNGVAALADTARFNFSPGRRTGRDQHWIGRRPKEDR
ncbi:MAG: bifunctional diaminohydroxyphosphoribosylaminopyrimidine deaminase/5-amino-6-(5-phosphoribosylamino)uracil reductase RibD [Pseudomonadota bacterium]